MNRKKYVQTTIEWQSTWWDHFRHIYSFAECLYTALQPSWASEPIINYDERKRFSITQDNIHQHIQYYKNMISWLQKNTDQEVIIRSNVYPKLLATSTVKRELLGILEHTNSHYSYFQPHAKWPRLNHFITSSRKMIDTVSNNDKEIEYDIQMSFDKYNLISKTIELPIMISREYDHVRDRYNSIHLQPKGYKVEYWETWSSISNELYKIEEILMHLLYDIRIFLFQYENIYYKNLIIQDPDFGIAHSTIQAKKN